MVPTVAVKMSVCINPILYIAFNPQFHGHFTRNPGRKSFGRRRHRKVLLGSRNEEKYKNEGVETEVNFQPLNIMLHELMSFENMTHGV